jgi:IS1 family transposase
VIAWAAGRREAALAETVVRQTRARTAGQVGVPWVSDGWTPYAEMIDAVYRDEHPTAHPRWTRLVRTQGIALTQAIKRRRGRRLVRVDVQATIGERAVQPYPVHSERLHGVLRDRLACLTRKTHAFSKRATTWDAQVGLTLFVHNWVDPHLALRQPLHQPDPVTGRRYRRRTPAMAIGLTDHVWSFTEFLHRPVPYCN